MLLPRFLPRPDIIVAGNSVIGSFTARSTSRHYGTFQHWPGEHRLSGVLALALLWHAAEALAPATQAGVNG